MRYKMQSLDNEILIIQIHKEQIQRNQSETRGKLISLPIPTTGVNPGGCGYIPPLFGWGGGGGMTCTK